MRNVFRRLGGILVARTSFLCVQLYKVLTADFDFAFVLTRSRQVVGQLHLQPRLRRAPERIIPLKAENDAPICPYRHGPQPPQVAFEWVQARLEEACENI